jgi:hypothetical protein
MWLYPLSNDRHVNLDAVVLIHKTPQGKHGKGPWQLMMMTGQTGNPWWVDISDEEHDDIIKKTRV